MSFTADLRAGHAQLIAAAGIGTYRTDGSSYLPTETAIVFGGMPPDPDRVIVLGTYTVTDDPSLSDSVIGLQVRCRGLADPADVDTIADAVFDLLHGKQAYTAGTVRVVEAVRNSDAPLGRDDNNRWERADNYYLTVHRPSANRT